MSAPDFSKKTIEILAGRAAHRCSNPDCAKITTGPHAANDKALTIGEAAHIYGARPSERRFRAKMSDLERASITNGIWLCRNCHGLIDKDPASYPVELLIVWKTTHDAKIRKEIGTAGDQLRDEVVEQSLAPFAHLPPFIRELIRDKPEFWEHILSAELLDHFWAPSLRRASDLERGLILRSRRLLPADQFPLWLRNKPQELRKIGPAIVELLSDLQKAWGASGEPGDAHEIHHVCSLFGHIAAHAVDIAEDAMFTAVPAGFEPVSDLLASGALHVLKNFPSLPAFLREIPVASQQARTLSYELVIDLPPTWGDDFEEAMERAGKEYQA